MTRPGSAPANRSSTKGGSAVPSRKRWPTGWGTWPWWPGPRWPSSTRPTPARPGSWPGTDRSPQPRCTSLWWHGPTPEAVALGRGPSRLGSLPWRSEKETKAGTAADETSEAVLVDPGERTGLTEGLTGEGSEKDLVESVEQPAKVMRIGSMVKQLLEEVRNAPLDEKSRTRLKEIHEQSVRELASALSPDLAAELDRMALPFDDVGSFRGRAPDRPGPAGGLARGSLPRHPGHPDGPTDGGPGPTERDEAAGTAGRPRTRRRLGDPARRLPVATLRGADRLD